MYLKREIVQRLEYSLVGLSNPKWRTPFKGDDIVSTSRENLEQFIRERAKCSELSWRKLCDYVDSSLTCNVTLCKIANDTLYGPSFTDAQKDNPKRRTATYGHGIELVNIVNNEEMR